MTYAEKLKDPRWQKKRLEVMNAARFECEWCGEKESELHIHHPAYRKGAEPWEYEARELACLCRKCHGKATSALHIWREMMLADKSGFMSFLELATSGVIDDACLRLIQIMSDARDAGRMKIGHSGSVAAVASDLFAAMNHGRKGKPAGSEVPSRKSCYRPAFDALLKCWKEKS